MQRRAPNLSRGFTLVELLVVITIFSILIGLTMPALQAVRESGRRTNCASNMKQLGMALNTYHQQYGQYPPAITVLRGENPTTTSRFQRNWIISILPFFDNVPLYKSFNFTKPISDSVNLDPRAMVLRPLLCPSDAGAERPYSGSDDGMSWARGNYAANSSIEILCTENVGMASEYWSTGWRRGLMGCNASAEPTDGASHTILLSEVRIGLSESDRRGVWAMASAGASSLWGHGVGKDCGPNACDSTADDIRGCSAVAADVGEERLARECMGCDPSADSRQATARSRHSGGVNICLADGSTHFISNSIEKSEVAKLTRRDLRTWERLNASGDGQPIDDTRW